MLDFILTTFQEMHWAELWAVPMGIIYVVLAARENIWCWLFGIVNAVLSVYLFYVYQLYAESILYWYYVLAGFYGWYAWGKKNRTSEDLKISTWTIPTHAKAIVCGVVLSLLLGYTLKYFFEDAAMPLIDAHTTIFSFIATYMTTRKILENWIYWIVIDIVTVGLYAQRDLNFYAILMVIYTVIAVIGFFKWKQAREKAE